MRNCRRKRKNFINYLIYFSQENFFSSFCDIIKKEILGEKTEPERVRLRAHALKTEE